MVVFALNTVLVVTSVPPVVAVYQPLKAKLFLVGVGKDASVQPSPVTPDVGFTVPPLALKVTVYVMSVHWA
jgi:hypothetical protein